METAAYGKAAECSMAGSSPARRKTSSTTRRLVHPGMLALRFHAPESGPGPSAAVRGATLREILRLPQRQARGSWSTSDGRGSSSSARSNLPEMHQGDLRGIRGADVRHEDARALIWSGPPSGFDFITIDLVEPLGGRAGLLLFTKGVLYAGAGTGSRPAGGPSRSRPGYDKAQRAGTSSPPFTARCVRSSRWWRAYQDRSSRASAPRWGFITATKKVDPRTQSPQNDSNKARSPERLPGSAPRLLGRN